jgi:hypothetical protein
MSDIRGIHYEISEPLQSPHDGYYYQRVRQVDENGNLVGIGEEVHRSVAPGSSDGLVGRSIDLGKIGTLALDVGKMAFGGVTRKPGTFASGAVNLALDVASGLNEDYKSWSGTDKPWEPLVDGQKGNPGQAPAMGASPPGKQGSLSAPPRSFDPATSPGNGFPPFAPVLQSEQATVGSNTVPPVRFLSSRYQNPRGFEMGDEKVSTGADASGASARRQGALAVPFNESNSIGGLPGMIAAAAGIDPYNPDQPPPAGGLLALLQANMRNNRAGGISR